MIMKLWLFNVQLYIRFSSVVSITVTVTRVDCRGDTVTGIVPDIFIGGTENLVEVCTYLAISMNFCMSVSRLPHLLPSITKPGV